jgi:hypothetical protein
MVLKQWGDVGGEANLQNWAGRGLSLNGQQVCENWGVTMEELRSESRSTWS